MNQFLHRLLAVRLALPPTSALLLALSLAFILPGLFGHDPWKTEDAIGTGVVHQMLNHGEWLVPHLAGEPFSKDGPLYYWIAAGFAWLGSPLLQIHSAARLASGAMMLFALAFTRLAAREFYGRPEGDAAALVLLGSLGLLVHAHENLPETGVLAAFALAMFSMGLARRRQVLAGVLLAIGWASAFLCKGIGAALIPGLAAVALPIACSGWRIPRYGVTLAIGATVGAAICSAWLTAAHVFAPAALNDWIAYQLSVLTMPTWPVLLEYGVTLSWAGWPAWPIALWTLWDRRRRLADPGTACTLAALVAAALLVATVPGNREINSLPLLVPLALLAGAGVPTLRRGAANALTWFGAMTFSFFGGLVWLGWIAMMTGTPEQIQRNFAKLEPGHVPQFQSFEFAVAATLTFAWFIVVFRSERSPFRGVTIWASGVALLWGLIMTLWIDWIDYGRTYRPVATAVRAALPPGTHCIESRGLGEAQRAVFDYHAEIVTRRAESSEPQPNPQTRCSVLLVQAHPNDKARLRDEGWTRIWEGNRPRDNERYRLYARSR